MILGMNNGVVLGNNPKWAFQVDNERTEYIVNILLITLFIIGSEKNRVLIPNVEVHGGV